MILTRLIAIFLLLSTSPLTRCQVVGAPPDFTGIWKIDREHSTAKALRDLEDLTFVISQNSLELHVKRIIKEKKHKERVRELTYFTDGRGEKIPFLFGSEKWNSKTKWVNNTLVSTFTVTQYISTNMDFYYDDYKETWALSRDGNTLTITTEIAVRNVPNFYRNLFTAGTYRKVFQKTP